MWGRTIAFLSVLAMVGLTGCAWSLEQQQELERRLQDACFELEQYAAQMRPTIDGGDPTPAPATVAGKQDLTLEQAQMVRKLTLAKAQAKDAFEACDRSALEKIKKSVADCLDAIIEAGLKALAREIARGLGLEVADRLDHQMELAPPLGGSGSLQFSGTSAATLEVEMAPDPLPSRVLAFSTDGGMTLMPGGPTGTTSFTVLGLDISAEIAADGTRIGIRTPNSGIDIDADQPSTVFAGGTMATFEGQLERYYLSGAPDGIDSEYPVFWRLEFHFNADFTAASVTTEGGGQSLVDPNLPGEPYTTDYHWAFNAGEDAWRPDGQGFLVITQGDPSVDYEVFLGVDVVAPTVNYLGLPWDLDPATHLSVASGTLDADGRAEIPYDLTGVPGGTELFFQAIVAGKQTSLLGVEVLAPFKRGDANGDLGVNLGDPIAILGYLFTGGTLTCLDAADTNDDSSVNLGDAIYLLGILFGSGNVLPAPFECGDDPTPDFAIDGWELGCVSTACP